MGAEIVSVDSMKIYRRMDIGTAKPSRDIRSAIPHHCLDLVEPSESFSVARYVQAADGAIAAIRAAGSVPLCVGGTSLYIKAMTEGLFEGPSGDDALRASLRKRAAREGLAKLHEELARIDPEAALRIHPNDERRIIRALEVHHTTGTPISRLQRQWDSPPGDSRPDDSSPPRRECVLIGLRREKDALNRRINLRVKTMLAAGLVDEARHLFDTETLSPQAAAAVGYAELFAHFQGRCSLDDAVEQIKINTRQLAKKQRTWQRRWNVQWFDCEENNTAEDAADRVLSTIEFR